MISSRLSGLVQILRDLITPASVGHFVLVRRDAVDLLRVVGRRRVECVLTSPVDQQPEHSFVQFAGRLAVSPCWYGQPFHVLIDNEAAFTYVRRLDTDSPAQIRETVESFRDDNTLVTFSVERQGGLRLLVVQGIAKDFLASLQQTLIARRLPVLGISTLAAFVAPSLATPEGSRVHLLEFPGSTACVVVDQKGHVLWVPLANGSSENDAVSQARAYLPGSDPEVAVEHYSSGGRGRKKSVSRERRLASLFSARIGSASAASRPAALPTSARTARTVDIALGSARLLASVLFAVVVLLMLTVSAVSLISSSDDPAVDEFQRQYSAKLELEAQYREIQEKTAAMDTVPTLTASPAAVASLFCQERPWGLYLDGVSLRPDDEGDLRVEAVGRALSERIAFAYQQDLGKLADPYTLTISSLAPEMVSSSGKVDTLVAFRLSMVVERGGTH